MAPRRCNALGGLTPRKDFVAGLIAVTYFLHPADTRIVTTSVNATHLNVLWGEIMRFVQTSKFPLRVEDGGPFYCTEQNIRKVVKGQMCPVSYLIGRVSAKSEGMAGHHATRTLAMIDECSGSDDEVFNQMETWAKKSLYWGNPLKNTGRFHAEVKAGDLLAH